MFKNGILLNRLDLNIKGLILYVDNGRLVKVAQGA